MSDPNSRSTWRGLNKKMQKSQSFFFFFYSILPVDVTKKHNLRCFLKLLTVKRISIRTRQPCRK